MPVTVVTPDSLAEFVVPGHPLHARPAGEAR
jgi:hypothetical protein